MRPNDAGLAPRSADCCGAAGWYPSFSRFGAQRAGYLHKVLAKELKDLETHQFISRTVHPGPPVVVDYHALPYAHSLNPVIEVLKAWGLQHQQRLEAGNGGAA